MKNGSLEYWEECVSEAAKHAGAELTLEQIKAIGEAVEISHDNYDLAFYTPPPSDIDNSIEREWKTKYDALQAEFDKYRGNAETAVKRVLKQRPDTNIYINDYGEVIRAP